MNYLAHAYLSFGDPEILTGNMISDFVKGKQQFDYPSAIRKGITLHRIIDTYTDDHAATRTAKEVFRPAYRLYSGAFVDVTYDHFLALDTNEFPGETLFTFSQQVYTALDRYTQWMPAYFAGMFPYMKKQNWLFNYRERKGTTNSFEGVVRRAAYLTESQPAALLFEANYQLLQECYRHFWADLKPFVYSQYQLLKENNQF